MSSNRMLQALPEHMPEQRLSNATSRAMHARTHVLTESSSPSISLLTFSNAHEKSEKSNV